MEGKAELELTGALRGNRPPIPAPQALTQQRSHHDGTGTVDKVASCLGGGTDRVNSTQEQLFLQVSTAQDVLLILSQGGDTKGVRISKTASGGGVSN